MSDSLDTQAYWEFGWEHGMGRKEALSRMWNLDPTGSTLAMLDKSRPQRDGESYPGQVSGWNDDTPIKSGRRAAGVDVAADLPGAPIVSDRARAVLERFVGNNAQFLGVVPMIGTRRVATHSYWILNVVALLDCINWKATPYVTTRLREYRSLEGELVLHPGRIPKTTHIFKCRYYPGPVIVSDTLRRALQRAKLSGSVYFGRLGAWIHKDPRSKLC